jgi:p-hydroxybenzoate 3-monooxygenase
VHHGIELRFSGAATASTFRELVPGRNITVYGQREVVRDLIAARLSDTAAGSDHLCFEVSDVQLDGLARASPCSRSRHAGRRQEFGCDWVVGCDGYHGVSRHWFPEGSSRSYEHVVPLRVAGRACRRRPLDAGTDLRAPRAGLRSAQHARAGALSVLPAGGGRGGPGAWSDERIWQELRTRLETVPAGGWSRGRSPRGAGRDAQLRVRTDASRAAVARG